MLAMPSKFLFALSTLLCSLTLCVSAAASDTPTPNDAQALVKKAVAFLKVNGKEKALAEFNNPKGQFVDRELYIFALDKDGATLANGVNPKIIGKNVMGMSDSDGKFFIKELFVVANTKNKGWVDYKWPDPVSKNIRVKTTYVEKADDVLICAGVYK